MNVEAATYERFRLNDRGHNCLKDLDVAHPYFDASFHFEAIWDERVVLV